MSDDLSPMLSQPQHDNAPMISGRGTKIIADARGAYLAGNAAALIERLDARQVHVFRLALIRLAHHYAEHAFRLLPDDAADHDTLAQVAVWLHDPTPDRDPTLLDQLLRLEIAFSGGLWRENQISGYSTESPTGDVLLRLALALNAPTALDSASIASEAVIQACWIGILGTRPYYWYGRRVSPLFKRQFRWITLRYQLETAWALLRAQSPPALPAHPAQPDTDLGTLLARMVPSQRLEFRQHIIDQALRAFQRYFEWGRVHAAEWACLDSVRDWLADPTDANQQLAMQRINAIPYGTDPRAQAIRNRVRSLIDAIRASSDINAAIFAMEPYVPTIDRNEPRLEWPEPLDAVQAWQNRVAWAIVHQEIVPPLWDEQKEVSR